MEGACFNPHPTKHMLDHPLLHTLPGGQARGPPPAQGHGPRGAAGVSVAGWSRIWGSFGGVL